MALNLRKDEQAVGHEQIQVENEEHVQAVEQEETSGRKSQGQDSKTYVDVPTISIVSPIEKYVPLHKKQLVNKKGQDHAKIELQGAKSLA